MQETPWLLTILLLPLAGACGIVLFRAQLSRTAAALIACTAVGLSFVATLLAMAQGAMHQRLFTWTTVNGTALEMGLLGDPLSYWWLLVITGVGFLIHVYSIGYMAEERSFIRYFAKLNYFIFAMCLLVLADNFMGLIMGWANVGFASYSLIGFYWERAAARDAAIKAFVVNLVGEVGLFLGTFLLFKTFGSFAFNDTIYSDALQAVPRATVMALGFLFLLGVAAKSAQLPLHTWLPDAMQGPTPVSALIHAATMVTAGVYLVSRAYPLFEAAPLAQWALAWLGGLSALFGALVASRQFDIKRVLAYSTMSQIGYMLMAVGVGAPVAGDFHFLTHAFFKAQLFLTAGIVIHALHGEQDIRRMGGLRQHMPFAYWSFAIGLGALAGVPLLSGFFSKDEILLGALVHGSYALYVVGFAAAALTAYYSARLFALVFLGAPSLSLTSSGKRNKRVENPYEHLHLPGQNMVLPVGLLGALAVAGGWIAIPGLTSVPEHYLALFPAAHHGGLAEKLITMGIAVAAFAGGLVLGWQRYRADGPSRARALETTGEPAGLIGEAFRFDLVYDVLVVRPVRSLSAFVQAKLEQGVVDAAVDGVASAAVRLASRVRTVHSGYVRRYALTVLAGVTAVIIYFVLVV